MKIISFHLPPAFGHHTYSGDALVNPIGFGDTNKQICCNCLSTSMYNNETGSWGSLSAFPIQWQSSALAVGRRGFYAEMAQWFPVYQDAYGHYNGHYFTWNIGFKCLSVWLLPDIFLRGSLVHWSFATYCLLGANVFNVQSIIYMKNSENESPAICVSLWYMTVNDLWLFWTFGWTKETKERCLQWEDQALLSFMPASLLLSVCSGPAVMLWFPFLDINPWSPLERG